MKKKVLVIDKDPAIIVVITFMLKDEGYGFLVSQKLFCLQAVKDYIPALILLHNGLNNEGSVICKSIKSSVDTKHIPVIMSSTCNDLPQIAEESCAEAYIQKPFDINDFLELIRSTLSFSIPTLFRIRISSYLNYGRTYLENSSIISDES